MRKVEKIEQKLPQIPTSKRVAAYARVSMESERLQHSLSVQVSYYSELIQKHPGWEYAGVYADDGITGTKLNAREEFNRMIADCEAGKIDIILTKSISRFARNTVDLLNTVRHLKDLGISVQFEKEHIDSLTEDGELMLTLLASFAQEEVRSLSDNVKWATRKRFEQGIPNGRFTIYGYRWEGDQLVIVPEEAKIVRLIYDNYLNGLSAETTEKQLAEMGVKSHKGIHFGNTSIRQILSNITYTGNLLFQKEYVTDPITKKSKKNHGELPQYYVENTHEPIISMETYQAVQAEKERRRELGVFANWSINTNCFTSKIKCGNCGKNYQRSTRSRKRDASYKMWICSTRRKSGNKQCIAKDIPEATLKKVCAKVLGLPDFDESIFSDEIQEIIVFGTDELEFHFYNGKSIRTKWKSTARTDCWSEERRKAWGELHKNKDTNPNRHLYNEFTGFIKCGHCGANYRSQTHKYVDGRVVRSWYCSSSASDLCVLKGKGIKDDTIKTMVADVLDLPEFDEEIFSTQLQYATVLSDSEMEFHFRDGHSAIRTYHEKKVGKPHTEEHKERMRKIMTEIWRERRAENRNNDTCDAEPIYGNTNQ